VSDANLADHLSSEMENGKGLVIALDAQLWPAGHFGSSSTRLCILRGSKDKAPRHG
jgi:hypothetical protein